MLLSNMPAVRMDGTMTMRQQIQELTDYVMSLSKQLQFVLQNIEEENIGGTLTHTIADMKSVVDDMQHKVSDGEFMSYMSQTAQAIEMRVQKNEVIASINLSPEEIAIAAQKIKLEGAVTVNGYFKIDADGKVIASGGKIGGWTIGERSLYEGYNSVEVSPTLYLGTEDIRKPVAVAGSKERADWRMKIGANFGVTADGILHMRGGTIEKTKVDTAGIDGYTELVNTVNELRQGLANTLHANALILNALTVGTTVLKLKQIVVNGETLTVLAAG
ncbi:MAG: hypothetical protein RR367_10165 [Clostridia bacterium]